MALQDKTETPTVVVGIDLFLMAVSAKQLDLEHVEPAYYVQAVDRYVARIGRVLRSADEGRFRGGLEPRTMDEMRKLFLSEDDRPSSRVEAGA